MPGKLQIIQTTDGSCTIYMQELDETYHSTHGALAESLHVYIRNGLQRLAEKPHLNILEVGFGTGLNALLTMEHQPAPQQIHYYALEPYPLKAETIHEYYSHFEQQPAHVSFIDHLLQEPHNLLRPVNEHFGFCVLDKKLQELEAADVPDVKFDLAYYDAFGPSKQEEMWTLETLRKVTDLMAPGGLLCTYCAQGQFKRNLKTLGLSVENPEGPWGKREMTVAIKINN